MTRVTFYNTLVVVVSLALLAFSVWTTLGGNWSKGNYFLILSFGMFSLLHNDKRN